MGFSKQSQRSDLILPGISAGSHNRGGLRAKAWSRHSKTGLKAPGEIEKNLWSEWLPFPTMQKSNRRAQVHWRKHQGKDSQVGARHPLEWRLFWRKLVKGFLYLYAHMEHSALSSTEFPPTTTASDCLVFSHRGTSNPILTSSPFSTPGQSVWGWNMPIVGSFVIGWHHQTHLLSWPSWESSVHSCAD